MPENITIAPKPGLESIRYYRVGIAKLPGFDHPIKLSSNESALGIAAVQDTAHRQNPAHTRRWRKQLIREFPAPSLKPHPSQTNFVLAGFPPKCSRTTNQTNTHLNRNGIIPPDKGDLPWIHSPINSASL